MKKHEILKGALCGAFFFMSSGLMASRYGYKERKDQVVARFGDTKYISDYYEKQNKKEKEIINSDPETVVCKYNDKGTIFAHGGNRFGRNVFISECNFYDGLNNWLGWEAMTASIVDVILSKGELNYIYLADKKTVLLWNDHRRENPTVLVIPGYYLDNIHFAPSGDKLLFCADQYVTFVYTTSDILFRWNRYNKDCTFLTDNYCIEAHNNSSLFSIFTVEKNPKEHILHGHKEYKAEQVIVSRDQKLIAVARTFAEGDLTKITLYDGENWREMVTYDLPGTIYSGPRYAQHKSISFSSDNKYLLVHVKIQYNGTQCTCYVDLNSGDITYIRHSDKNVYLYELCDYNKTFGGMIKGEKALIYDVRKPKSAAVELKLPGIEGFALNPDNRSKIKAILASGSKKYFYTGSSTTKE